MSSTSNSSSGPSRFGLGLSTIGGTGSNAGSLTAFIELDNKSMIQAILALPSTSPFQIFGAGLFKYTVSEQAGAGLHVGGGLGLGAVSSSSIEVELPDGTTVGGDSAFELSIMGVAGLHFPIAQKIAVHLDGGLKFGLIDGDANFGISPFSEHLGITVAYMF